ncbi:hypothetical protein MIR68_012103 [Amoeboaphelidium protococcarum]|nr:hypothetical protein MIR68_012103 [Amoeboaphelidium protococcarum]
MKAYFHIVQALLLLSQVQCLPMLSSSQLEWIPIGENQSGDQFQNLFNSADPTSDEELLVDNAHAQSQMAERYPFISAIEDPYADDLKAFDTGKNDLIANDMNAFNAADNDVIPQRHGDQSKKSNTGFQEINHRLNLEPKQRLYQINRDFSPLSYQGGSSNILPDIAKYLDQDYLIKDSHQTLKDELGDKSLSSYLQADFMDIGENLDDLLYSAQSQDFEHSKYVSVERGELQRSQSSNDVSKVAGPKQKPIEEKDLYAHEVLSDFENDEEDNVVPKQQRDVGEVMSSYRRRAI